ncbi:Sec-independent protein translocase subunit TatA [Pseudonocardia acaciae]|uniref:Sec-independent protein translocase subunit TatA n=1 Tax=Pseudonocardia acaciae TaxID=551276 RepID=UPI00048FE5C8|nr:Sec-independent protein translocase subunit TatA [Pseudonocardia acaciae]
MGAWSPTHWLIVLAVVVLLFGAKRLPELARGVGRSARILKSETSGLADSETKSEQAAAEPKADQAATSTDKPGTGTPPGPRQGTG